ncbi:MAG: SRPBCC domain-containing protein [Dehalococcoidia bacterium]|nr:SRPBCC domain-containing protein [Dehalococcoidia bacterium]
MDFVYDRVVVALTTTVWDVLTNSEAMEPYLPGTAKVASTGADSYRVSMKISVGFLRPTVNTNVQLSEVNELESFVIELSGKSMGAGVKGNAEVVLSALEDSTRIQMTGTVETSGLLKKVPESKIEAAAIGFLESYFASVEKAFARSL